MLTLIPCVCSSALMASMSAGAELANLCREAALAAVREDMEGACEVAGGQRIEKALFVSGRACSLACVQACVNVLLLLLVVVVVVVCVCVCVCRCNAEPHLLIMWVQVGDKL